jgi:hypothetical protein
MIKLYVLFEPVVFMSFHPVIEWFGVNNVIGWVGFNFLLIFLVGCGMDVKVTRFGCGLGFLPLAVLFTALSRNQPLPTYWTHYGTMWWPYWNLPLE